MFFVNAKPIILDTVTFNIIIKKKSTAKTFLFRWLSNKRILLKRKLWFWNSPEHLEDKTISRNFHFLN